MQQTAAPGTCSGSASIINDCVCSADQCQQPILKAQKVIYDNLGEFQESLPNQPKEQEVAKAQEKMSKCMDQCGQEFGGKVPRLKSDIEATLKKLAK
eukprot:jgi/Chrzof1/13005/Cz07g16050.t1